VYSCSNKLFSTLIITSPRDTKAQLNCNFNFAERDKHYELASSIVIIHISNLFYHFI
jgi:CRISPR/Cas system-associated protein Csm6